MNENTTQKATQTKQEWASPALKKMDIAEITKSGPNSYPVEDPYNNFYGPS